MSQTAPRIVAKDLHRSFQIGTSTIKVLRGMSLSIEPRERVFLVGTSGAGKTTLLYTLGGLEKPEEGEVMIGDQSLYGCSRARRAKVRNSTMGFVFQNYHLLPELTALENVTLPARISSRASTEEAKTLLERVGLAPRMNHLPAELSGGEQQRVAIARALINDPPILFADEPTGNLDSANGEEVMELLLGIAGAEKRTLVVVTHDPKLAELGDRQVRLADGRIAA